MTTASAARATVASPMEVDTEASAQRVVVYDCNRIGLRANPPGFSFADLFRAVWRRRR